jgi:hypothetical protein
VTFPPGVVAVRSPRQPYLVGGGLTAASGTVALFTGGSYV